MCYPQTLTGRCLVEFVKQMCNDDYNFEVTGTANVYDAYVWFSLTTTLPVHTRFCYKVIYKHKSWCKYTLGRVDCKRVTSSKCCPAKIDKLAHLDFHFKSAAQRLRNAYVESGICACVGLIGRVLEVVGIGIVRWHHTLNARRSR